MGRRDKVHREPKKAKKSAKRISPITITTAPPPVEVIRKAKKREKEEEEE
jgi:hypothetical protein